MTSIEKFRAASLAVVAPAICFSTMIDTGYRLVSAELLIICLSTAAVGAFLGLIIGKFRALFLLVFTVVAVAFLDANLIGPRQLKDLEFLGLLCLVFLVLFLLERRAIVFLSVFAFAFSVGALVEPKLQSEISLATPDRPAQSQVGPPPSSKVLHIVLDELGSVNSLAGTIERGHPSGNLVKNLVSQGFQVFSTVETPAPTTKYTLSGMVGLDGDVDNYVVSSPHSYFSFSVKDNHLHQSFVKEGFKVSILQTNYLDFCNGLSQISCETVNVNGNMRDFSEQSLLARLNMARLSLHQNFAFGERSAMKIYWMWTVQSYVRRERKRLNYGSFALPVTVKKIFSKLPERVETMQDGEVIFAHFGLPHFPYILDQTCDLKPVSDWGFSSHFSGNGDLRPEPFEAYWDQVACTMDLLSPTLKAAEKVEDLTVIIHGDHGPRIVWEGSESTPEYVMQTLVAVREPGRDAGQMTEPIPLFDVINGVLGQHFQRQLLN